MRNRLAVHLGPLPRSVDNLLWDLAVAAAEADVREMVRREVRAARERNTPPAELCAGDVTDKRGAWLVGYRSRRSEVS